ncbi:MAG TPA: hypothetical protein VFL76_02425 [Edaphocola sp.]|nr:hypothetical protein [Edaphocola sp.]
MNIFPKVKQALPLILALAFTGSIFLLFPTHNSTSDAIGYAADIKYGVPTMFTPHHLLYNKFFELLSLPFRKLFSGLDLLAFAKTLNGLFAISVLALADRILKKAYDYSPGKSIPLLLATAFCFGFWRFSIENESYIVAIFFSLLASNSFLNLYLSEGNKALAALTAGLWAAIACLFHQINFFWWLGLLISVFYSKSTRKYTLIYSIPAVIVPVTYGLVLVYNYHQTLTISHFIHFVFYSYFSGSAPIVIGPKNIFFTAVAMIRTFIQIYPTQLTLLKSNVGYYLPLGFGIFILYYLFKNRSAVFLTTMPSERNKKLRSFVSCHILIISLQFLFAAFSMGNAKFMIMLPLLIILTLPYFGEFNRVFTKLLVGFLFLWNFGYGIWPDYHYNYYNSQHLAAFMQQHPEAILISRNYGIGERYRYTTGIDPKPNLIDVSIRPLNKKLVDSLLRGKKPVYTDLISYPTVYNRDYFTDDISSDSFWKPFNFLKTDSFRNFYGKVYISRLKN